jgi:hypothetical protein
MYGIVFHIVHTVGYSQVGYIMYIVSLVYFGLVILCTSYPWYTLVWSRLVPVQVTLVLDVYLSSLVVCMLYLCCKYALQVYITLLRQVLSLWALQTEYWGTQQVQIKCDIYSLHRLVYAVCPDLVSAMRGKT